MCCGGDCEDGSGENQWVDFGGGGRKESGAVAHVICVPDRYH